MFQISFPSCLKHLQIELFDVVFFLYRTMLIPKVPCASLQLFILLGKYHIHVKKWAKAKPNFEHFMKEIKQYGNSLDKIKNKKARKTYEAFCTLNLL